MIYPLSLSTGLAYASVLTPALVDEMARKLRAGQEFLTWRRENGQGQYIRLTKDILRDMRLRAKVQARIAREMAREQEVW